MKINDSHLVEGEKVFQVEGSKREGTPFHFKKGTNVSTQADTLVIHYTAGGSAKSSANYLAKDSTVASAHIVIGRDGTIFQLIPFNFKAKHAGESAYAGRKYINQYSIGIELANAGPLQKVGNSYVSWFKAHYDEKDVIKAVHRNETKPRYWHDFTEAQIKACEELSALLIEKYNIDLIVGHEEISPGRKIDPGPAFPLDKFRDRLLGNGRSDNSSPTFRNGVVNVNSALNIREGAGSTYKKVAKPLKRGTDVTVLEEKDGWLKVKVEIEGWVSKSFIQKKGE